MKYLKAVIAGSAAAVMALVVVWVLSSVALTAYISLIGWDHIRERAVQTGGLDLPKSTVWIGFAMAVLAAAGSFWAGCWLVLRSPRAESR